MEWLQQLLDYSVFQGTGVEFRIIRLLNFFVVLLLARLFLYGLFKWITPKLYNRSQLDMGMQYATNQIIKYIVYVIALLAAVQSLGINLTVIWGAAAALAVGFGLGIQQTFNDLASGIILLFERSVEVGDILEVDGLFGRVQKIGVRTTKLETFDNVVLIVPNSKIVGNKVINWSHNDDIVRFMVEVGVAYGSDTGLVKKLLIQSATKHPKVLKSPEPFVRFEDFSNSALKFQVYYWSREFINNKNIKSDIRFLIDKAFRENGVEIPFPQRDVWIRSEGK